MNNLNRRDILRIGFSSFLGLNIGSFKFKDNMSLISIFMDGGLSHIDTYDYKPNAPLEIRGNFLPINTAIPGYYFPDVFMKQSKITNQMCIINSFSHDSFDHNFAEYRVLTGHSKTLSVKYPSFNSMSARLLTKNHSLPYLFLGHYNYNYMMGTNNSELLSHKFNPMYIDGDPNKEEFKIDDLELIDGITVNDLNRRSDILKKIDRLKRLSDKTEEMDLHQKSAIDILSSSNIGNALNIKNETDTIREKYGRTEIGQKLLLARRLIEIGIPVVGIESKASSSWDFHSDIYNRMPSHLIDFDNAIYGLVTDLEERSLLNNVLVVIFSEFGRTPKINDNLQPGRDHWPNVSSIIFIGGKSPRGHIYGQSDWYGEKVKENIIGPEDFLSTVYGLLDFNTDMRIKDRSGQEHLISNGKFIDLTQ